MPANPLASLHSELGASLVERAGTKIPSRFGDPAEEHRAVRKAVGVFDLASAGRFWLTGPERLRFLDGLLAADVYSLAPGRGCYALLLSREGRIASEVRVAALGDRALVLTPPIARGKVARTFERHRVATEVTIEDATERTTLLSAQGPGARALVTACLGTALPEIEPWGAAEIAPTTFGPVVVLRSPRTGEDGLDLLVGAGAAAALFRRMVEEARAAGGLPGGLDALESLRIESGRPAFGAEIDETTFPYEVPEVGHGITFTKGCFLGRQEVERAQASGNPPRRVAGLVLGAAVPPVRGDKVKSGETVVGRVTSACWSPAFQRAIALAVVEAACAAPGTELSVADGEKAAVHALPFVAPKLA